MRCVSVFQHLLHRALSDVMRRREHRRANERSNVFANGLQHSIYKGSRPGPVVLEQGFEKLLDLISWTKRKQSTVYYNNAQRFLRIQFVKLASDGRTHAMSDKHGFLNAGALHNGIDGPGKVFH